MPTDAIRTSIAGALGVPVEYLTEKRHQRSRGARDLYAYVLHTFAELTSKQVAEIIGVHHAEAKEKIASVRRQLDGNEGLETFVDRIGPRVTMQARVLRQMEDDRAELGRLFPNGPNAAQIAYRYKINIADAAPLLSQFCDNAPPAWRGGEASPTKDSKLSRFGTKKPTGGVDLKVNHPALVDGRTIFPSTVVSVRDTERLLVSGHNNPKLGAEIQKGPWKGFPIYHLTLEERADALAEASRNLNGPLSRMPARSCRQLKLLPHRRQALTLHVLSLMLTPNVSVLL